MVGHEDTENVYSIKSRNSLSAKIVYDLVVSQDHQFQMSPTRHRHARNGRVRHAFIGGIRSIETGMKLTTLSAVD